jgi:hypothetical protein
VSYKVEHRCEDAPNPTADTLAMIRRPEDGVIILACRVCREDFWIVDRDAYDLWARSRVTTGTEIPGFLLPGVRT